MNVELSDLWQTLRSDGSDRFLIYIRKYPTVTFEPDAGLIDLTGVELPPLAQVAIATSLRTDEIKRRMIDAVESGDRELATVLGALTSDVAVDCEIFYLKSERGFSSHADVAIAIKQIAPVGLARDGVYWHFRPAEFQELGANETATLIAAIDEPYFSAEIYGQRHYTITNRRFL